MVAAVFCLLVWGVMVAQHFRAKADDPLKSPGIALLKEKLHAAPKDESLKQAIRALDLTLRERFFQLLSLNRQGRWLLLVAAAALFLLGRRAARMWTRLPLPQPDLRGAQRAPTDARQARWAVAALGVMIAAAFLSLALPSATVLPSSPAELDKLLARAAGTPEEDEMLRPDAGEFWQNWPRFRGPDGNAVSSATNFLASWNATTGEGIAWKTPVPAPGWGSPVVWGNRVFVSGGDALKRSVFCFDALSGAILWQRAVENVPGGAAKQPEIPEGTGFAAPTMATDGRRAYVFFANGDLAAFTLEGAPVWAKSLGVPKNAYGHASSPIVWRQRLLLQLDQGDVEERKSKLYALDGATGRVLWQRNRPVPSSWATPVVITAAGKDQVITLGVPWLISYAAGDGNELWRADCLNGEVTPSPIFARGMVLAISPNEKLVALRPDGQGDVTKTHAAWSYEDNVPDIPSPTSDGEFVYMVSTHGMLTCLDAADGKKQWEQDLALECNASPSVARGKLYVFGNKGAAVVAAAGRQFKELGRAELGEAVLASPAFVGDRIYVRGATNLFCLGKPAARGATQPGNRKP